MPRRRPAATWSRICPRRSTARSRSRSRGDTAYGAAWGDPAIVLTCGTGEVDVSDAPPCTVVEGVGWVVPEEGDETVFTADGYAPRVQVVVPDAYAPQAEVLLDLSPLVKRYAEREADCL